MIDADRVGSGVAYSYSQLFVWISLFAAINSVGGTGNTMVKSSELIWQDKQHQMLFDLIEQIEEGVSDKSVFGQLTFFAESHFNLEEEYMRRLGFPGLEAHLQAHNRFRSELDSMMEACEHYDPQFCQVLAEFLREWLTGHIFGIDKQLEAFIIKSELK